MTKKCSFMISTISLSLCVSIFFSCYRAPEMTLAEIEAARSSLSNELYTIYKNDTRKKIYGERTASTGSWLHLLGVDDIITKNDCVEISQ